MADAQIQQLHAQVTLLTSQVQHLNGLADGQAQRIALMGDYEQMKQTVIQLQQRGVAPGHGNTGSDAGKYLVNIKDVKIENVYGDESKFTDFVEDTKTYTDVIMPDLGEILEWLGYQPKNLTGHAVLNHVGENFVNFNRTVSGFLKVRLRGKARNWLKAQPIGEGLLNWKKMLHKYDPMTGSTRLDLQNKITSPGVRCTNAKDVPAAIEAWDASYQKYQQRMGHELDDEMMQNILLRKLPAKFEQTIRMNIQLVGKETTYASLRQEILDMCVHYVGASIATPMDLNPLEKEKDGEASGWSDDQVSAWMQDEGYLDVDGLDKKGSKGKGKGKGGKGGKGQWQTKGKGKGSDIKCGICERTGHEEKACWCNPKSSLYKGEAYAKKVLEKLGKNLNNLEGDWNTDDAGLLEGLYDEECNCLSLAALDIDTVSGEEPPLAEEPGGGGETQSRFAHRNRFEVEDDGGGLDSENPEDESEDDYREEEEDEEVETLANDLSKLKRIGGDPDPWTSDDPWRKSIVDGKVTTHISDATKKFDERLAEIMSLKTAPSTEAASS